MRALVVLAIVVIVALVAIAQTLYVVDQREQVIVTRFGEVQQIHKTPGLYYKMPFVDVVERYDKRLLRIDAPEVAMPDIEKQSLIINSYGRYRIVDPVQFRKTLGSDMNARSRLGDIINASLRAEIANSTRPQIIGGDIRLDEQGNTVVIATDTRSQILDRVLASVRRTIATQSEPFGIEMVDVRIKRADFPDSVADSIFTRMRAERNRIASRFRAEGDEQDRRIRADVDRRRDIVLAEAERDANINRGEGDAQAVAIFAEALQQDPEFFQFRRSLEAYKIFLKQNSTVVLTADSPLLQFLQDPSRQPAATPAPEPPAATPTPTPPAPAP